MKTQVFILLILTANLLYCQNAVIYDKRIVENHPPIGILEAPFMIDEFIEIYRLDSSIIKRVFNREIFNRTEYNLYCYNVCTDFFYTRLIKAINNENKETINEIASKIDYDQKFVKPNIDWSKVFETCQNCPFGQYPDEMMFYFKIAILFMGEEEIKTMVKDDEGKQWKYVLEDIKYGDAFTLNKDGNYYQYVLDRRIANYVIERWKDSDIKGIQELIAVYKSVM